MYAYRTCTVWYALILIIAGTEPLIIPLQGIEAVFGRLWGLFRHCIAFPWNDMPNWVLFRGLSQPTFDYVFGTIVCDLDDFDDHWIDVFYLKKKCLEINGNLGSKKPNDLNSWLPGPPDIRPGVGNHDLNEGRLRHTHESKINCKNHVAG